MSFSTLCIDSILQSCSRCVSIIPCICSSLIIRLLEFKLGEKMDIKISTKTSISTNNNNSFCKEINYIASCSQEKILKDLQSDENLSLKKVISREDLESEPLETSDSTSNKLSFLKKCDSAFKNLPDLNSSQPKPVSNDCKVEDYNEEALSNSICHLSYKESKDT